MTAPGLGVSVGNGWPLPAAGYAIHAFGGDPKVATPPDDVKDAVRMVADVGGAAAQVAPPLAIRVRIRRCYFHCAKAFLRSNLWVKDTWPEPFALSWGEWAQQWYGIPDDAAREVDATIETDARERL